MKTEANSQSEGIAPASAGVDVPNLLPQAERAHLQRGRRIDLDMNHGRFVWHEWRPEGSGPDMPTVVLLHGGSGSWTHWVRNILPLLRSGRRVLAPDLPGFGASDPAGPDADAMLEPLAHALGRLSESPAVDLVGFSFGGMVGGMLLAAFPALAQRLVLVGAPALGLQPVQAYRLKGWRHFESAAAQAEAHRHNLGALMLHDAGHISPLALQVHTANAERDRLPRRRLSRTDVLARCLPRLSCPVQAICGEHDVLYRGQWTQAVAVLEQAPRFAGLQRISGAGHWVQFEASTAFDAALAAALGLSTPADQAMYSSVRE